MDAYAHTHKSSHTRALTTTCKESYKISTSFDCTFSIFDSFPFLNCLMIVVLKKTP